MKGHHVFGGAACSGDWPGTQHIGGIFCFMKLLLKINMHNMQFLLDIIQYWLNIRGNFDYNLVFEIKSLILRDLRG